MQIAFYVYPDTDYQVPIFKLWNETLKCLLGKYKQWCLMRTMDTMNCMRSGTNYQGELQEIPTCSLTLKSPLISRWNTVLVHKSLKWVITNSFIPSYMYESWI